jgi:hypothetical protein
MAYTPCGHTFIASFYFFFLELLALKINTVEATDTARFQAIPAN